MSESDNYDYEKDFYKKFEEERKKQRRPVILISGYTGVGKTSIVQTVFGKEIVPDDKIGHGEPNTQSYEKYENEFAIIYDSKGLEQNMTDVDFIKTSKDFIRRLHKNETVENCVNVFWYVISGSGARVTASDIKIIKEVFGLKSTIVIISKSEHTKPKQMEAMKKKLINEGINETKIIPVSSDKYEAHERGHGFDKLDEMTLHLMPDDGEKIAYTMAQEIDINRKIDAIKKNGKKSAAIITSAVTAAAAAGASPIPFSQSAILIPIQVGMIVGLSVLYKFDKRAIKTAALPFVAKVVGVFLSSELLKLFPGVGSVINAVLASTITGAMGLYVKNQFEKIAIAKAKKEPIPNELFDLDTFKEFFMNYKK